MTDLKQQLNNGIKSAPAIEPPPIGSLLERTRGRRRRRWFTGTGAAVIVAVTCLAVVVDVERGHVTNVKIAIETAPSSPPRTLAHGANYGPVYATIPDPAMATCSAISALSNAPASPALTTIDPDPTGVVAVWNPGMNARPCRVDFSRGDAVEAQALAAAILSEPAFPPGGRSCPADFGRNVNLYFSYGGDGPAEIVQQDLSGCEPLFAPGRASRLAGNMATSSLLASIAPPSYRSYLPLNP
jgi:hypothetical protein